MSHNNLILYLIFLFFQQKSFAVSFKTYEEERAIQKLMEEFYSPCMSENLLLCPLQDYSFVKGLPRKDSLGQRILILDSEREQNFQSLLFYNKKRALNLFRLSPDNSGSLEPYEPKALAPRVLSSLFLLLDSAKEQGLAIESMKIDHLKLLKLHHKIHWKNYKLPEPSHGQKIFDLLARYNPKAQFVIGAFPEVEREVFCEIHKEPSRVNDFFQRAAASYLEVIREYKINFVNISYATTLRSLEGHNRRLCQGNLKKRDLEYYITQKSMFLDRLSREAPDTLFLQALPNEYEKDFLSEPISQLFSAKKRPNFLRVAYWSHYRKAGENLSAEDLFSFLPKKQRKLWAVVDLYVNSGFQERQGEKFFERKRRNILEIPYAGFYLSSNFLMSNSYAVPLALSHLNYLKNKSFLNPSFLKSKVKDPLLRGDLLFYN